jgi:thioredoxin reductase
VAKNDVPRLAILGAGPIGLEAALYARKLNLPVAVYERGQLGEHVRRWGHVKLFSPFGMNVTPLGRAAILAAQPRHEFPADTDCVSGRDHIEKYLKPLSQTEWLAGRLSFNHNVLSIGRRGLYKDDMPSDARKSQPFRLLVREGNNRERIEEADIVLDCTGTYGQHRWLGDGGIAAIGESAVEQQIAYGVEDVLGERRNHYAGRTVLVIGGGFSAATTVCNLARLAEDNNDTWVVWLTRGSGTQPLRRVANDPLRERDRLAVKANTLATRAEGNVEFHARAVVEQIDSRGHDKGFRVEARVAGDTRTWDVDRIIANVGYAPDTGLYRELQIHECYASQGPMALAAALAKHSGGDCLTVPATGANTLRNPEPGFFILGSKSYGRGSHFLLRTGFEQIRDVFQLIMNKSDLDLYKKK